MKKGLLVSSLIASLLLVSCGGGASSEKDKLASTAAEMFCLAQEGLELMSSLTAGDAEELDLEALEAKGKELEEKAMTIITDAGYADQDAFAEAMDSYQGDEEMEKMIMAMAEEKCGATMADFEAMGGF